MSGPVIAVDGPTASGKGTLARRIAAALDFAHLDTGTLYRAVAAKLLEAGANPDDAVAAAQVAEALTTEDLNRPDLRRESVSQAASRVARLSSVREALLDFQRRFARRPPDGRAGAVLDGRDIGTVVCPEAEVKLFVTASAEVRAVRRHRELLDRGEESIYARVLQDLEERDARDSGRAVAPLKAARDAVAIDTSDMDIDTAFEAAMTAVEEALMT
jgi:cytidylate kinase